MIPQFGNAARKLVRLARLVLASYLCVVVMMMLFERSLIYPMPEPTRGDWEPKHFAYEDVWLTTDDEYQLHGWYLPCQDPHAVIVHFNGNGEDVASCGEYFSQWRDRLRTSILVMDYRGYGKSEGKPREDWLIQDGVLACQWVAKREGIEPSDLIVWGRSIGGGVAAGVSETIHPRGLVMETTFDALTRVAAHHMPWIPVSLCMRNRYPSAQRLAGYQGDYLQWHGDGDSIVPLEHAKRLFEAVGSAKKQWVLGQGFGHNDGAPQEFARRLKRLVEMSSQSKASASNATQLTAPRESEEREGDGEQQPVVGDGDQ